MAPAISVNTAGGSSCPPGLHATLRACEQMIQSLDAVVWIADPLTLHVFCLSRGAERILGYPSDPYLADTDFLRHHVHPDDRERVLAQLRACIGQGLPARLAYRGLTADGQEVQLRNHVRLVADASGCTHRLLGIIIEVSDPEEPSQAGRDEQARLEAERLAAELQQAAEARERLLAMVVHELRNPLNSMIAAVEMIRTSSPGEKPYGRALDVMDRSLKLQSRLVEDLMQFSAARWGQLRLVREVLELHTVVADAVEGQRAAAEAASLSLSAALPPGLWVDADRDRLQQAVTNLVGNAIKYTAPGGEVVVRVQGSGFRVQEPEAPASAQACAGQAGPAEAERTAGGASPTEPRTLNPEPFEEPSVAQVIVEDTGMGISPEVLDTLFDVFRRGEAAASVKPGLGIGLALVRAIAELHGGRVWAESEGLGKGSRFVLELPSVPPPLCSPPPPA